MVKRKTTIGVFDSGFGGLTILKSILKELPGYDYVYLGDTARAPYGNRSSAIVYQFVTQAIDFLVMQGCSLIILACNTASCEALRRIQQEYIPAHHPTVKVLGVIVPAAEEAVEKSRGKRIGVMATAGTVRSEAFVRQLHKLDSEVRVFQQACPLFVPFIEAGEHHAPAMKLVAQNYVRSLHKHKIDTVILGCTHYSIIKPLLQEILGPQVVIIDEPRIVAKKLAIYLQRHPEIESRLLKRSRRVYFSTDLTDGFARFGKHIMREKLIVRQAVLS